VLTRISGSENSVSCDLAGGDGARDEIIEDEVEPQAV
jgi:hypothetical protein